MACGGGNLMTQTFMYPQVTQIVRRARRARILDLPGRSARGRAAPVARISGADLDPGGRHRGDGRREQSFEATAGAVVAAALPLSKDVRWRISSDDGIDLTSG